MASPEINRENVTDRMTHLRSVYDGVTTVEKRREVAPEVFPQLLDGSREGYIGGAYAWVVRAAENAPPLSPSMGDVGPGRDRALMILGRGDERWGLPGGGQEGSESFAESAVREVREETGIDCSITDCFLIRHRVTTSEGFDARLHTLQVFFDARHESGTISIQGGECNGAAWFAEPPAEMLPANERRATAWFDD